MIDFYLAEDFVSALLYNSYNENILKSKKKPKNNWKKWALVGSGAVVGGTIAIITGGLLLPAVGGLISTIGIISKPLKIIKFPYIFLNLFNIPFKYKCNL